ncbi:molybdenum cofactor biosynthesis protein MoaE [Halocynthiibacter namhaensis]|uniref:molybdenum cofactor biosynthesis protein MoaE n=1 Tax=Halocynthiibacter namhaensis TaxID=1290553 RepID=UPI0005790749|nr:molybdenum cofactor biosynthesis protein MoaE [Halocynthiibacter namhaensis]
MDIRVQEEPFHFGTEAQAFSDAQDGAGAIVTFTGLVRDLPGTPLDVMEIEHYPGMTERALAKIAQDASKQWELSGSLIIHRFGAMRPGDQIMMVATASKHRKDAFEAAEFLMDFLKSRAPFWKREITADNTSWVESKPEDEDALSRWDHIQ